MKNNNGNGKSANSIRTHWLFKLNDATFICLSEIEHTKCKAMQNTETEERGGDKEKKWYIIVRMVILKLQKHEHQKQ